MGETICNNVPKQECHAVPRQECHAVPRQECTSVPRQACRDVPRQVCKSVPQKVARQVCKNVVSTGYGKRHGWEVATWDYQALECSSPFHELKIQIPDYQDLSYSVAFGAMTGAKHIVELL